VGEGFDAAQALRVVEEGTGRFIATVDGLTEEELRGPSLCEGWTRGHVATHVARNAEGLVNLLTWARTGQEVRMYPSAEARNAAIEAGSGRPRAELVADLRATAGRFAEAVAAVPPERWDAPVEWRTGVTRPARAVLFSRRQEVEIHHVDLDAGYTPAHWDPGFVTEQLDRVSRDFSAREGVPAMVLEATDSETGQVSAAVSTWRIAGAGSPISVTGPRAALLAWLIGRSKGDGLVVAEGSLPTLPPWA
jgi:maleylpyruvate isomerase